MFCSSLYFCQKLHQLHTKLLHLKNNLAFQICVMHHHMTAAQYLHACCKKSPFSGLSKQSVSMYHSVITHTANLKTETDWMRTKLQADFQTVLNSPTKNLIFFPSFANAFSVSLLATFEDDGIISRYLLCKEKKD